MFTIFSQIFYIIVIGGQKSNFSGRIKLEPITTCHLDFVMKMLLKCCRRSTHQKLFKETNQRKSSN